MSYGSRPLVTPPALHIPHPAPPALRTRQPATWHLAPGTWHLAPGTWHLAPGTWHLDQPIAVGSHPGSCRIRDLPYLDGITRDRLRYALPK
jgi:hypothetical protein